MRGRIPKQIRLPGPYPVSVSIVGRPHPRCGAKAGSILTEDDDAAWSAEDRAIYIWEGLTPRQKWLKLVHEFRHLANDYELWIRQQVGAE